MTLADMSIVCSNQINTKMSISVVMPTLNEEESISKIINKIRFEFKKSRINDFNIFIVDGGSSDNTIKIAKNKKIKIINSERGYGIQYQNAFKKIKSDYIITMDCDNTYSIKDGLKLLSILKSKKLDFISGDRISNIDKIKNKDIKKTIMPQHLLIANKYLNFWINLIFNIKLKDSQSGMWVFRRNALRKINLKSYGMPLSEEIKIEAFRKTNFLEIPISYNERIGKKKLRSIIDGHHNFFYLFYKKLIILFEKT